MSQTLRRRWPVEGDVPMLKIVENDGAAERVYALDEHAL